MYLDVTRFQSVHCRLSSKSSGLVSLCRYTCLRISRWWSCPRWSDSCSTALQPDDQQQKKSRLTKSGSPVSQPCQQLNHNSCITQHYTGGRNSPIGQHVKAVSKQENKVTLGMLQQMGKRETNKRKVQAGLFATSSIPPHLALTTDDLVALRRLLVLRHLGLLFSGL